MSSIEIRQHILSYKNLKKLNRALAAILPTTLPILFGAVSLSANAVIRDGSTGEKITISSPDVGASNYSPNGIAIGNGSYIENMGPDTKEGIAIGTNAKSLDGNSTRRTGFSALIYGAERKNLPGGVSGIAIGLNTYANESTVDIGAKSGGSEANGANRRASVTVGADSYAAAHFSTITGAYSSIKTTPSRDDSPSLSGFGSVISGALNTMDVKKYGTYNGMANAITGTANVIENSNGALIMGAGNKISNSQLRLSLSETPDYDNITNPNKLYDLLSKEDSNGKKPELASVGIFGGANEVDNSHFVNVSGVDNRLKGAESGTSSEFVSIDGYRNRATNVSHLSMQGSENTVTNATENIVMGNYNKVLGDNTDRSDAKRNVVLGFQDEDSAKIGKNIANNQLIGSDITVQEGTKNSVLIGDQAEISASNVDDATALNGAVALGAKSVADRQAINSESVETSTDEIPAGSAAKTNKVYALEAASQADKEAIKKTVKGNLAAVSVGNAENTRQITNLAAGSEDTDAVNVAQLKSVANAIKQDINTANSSTWNLAVNDEDATKNQTIGGSNTVNFKSSDKNIKISKHKQGDKVNVDMALSDEVRIGGTTVVQNGAPVQQGGTVINANGVMTNGGNGPSITTSGVNAGGKRITNVAAGVAPTDAVNVSQLDSVRNQLNNVINTNWSMSVNDESPETVARTDTVNFNNSDNNIKLVKTRNGNKINVDMKLNDTVRIGGQNGTVINNHGIMTNGGNGPSITTSGVNAGNKRITNVAAGVAPTDAVNVSQLNGVKGQIDNVDKSARAGIAGALATANLYQAYHPGHSMVSVGMGTFRGQNAIAIGASRLSDSGHIGVKLSGMTTSQGDVGAAMSVGYQW
ncbi:YadA family autotransporter adhesin [Avibacterium avium]|uniref:YadA family autotransporter adhesin n=1 Tax=Avibacterium avium TaxID=751 RepID=UPI003BF8DC04